MSHELIEMSMLLNIVSRALVAKGILTKEDLLAELSRSQTAPSSAVTNIQELILNLPDQ